MSKMNPKMGAQTRSFCGHLAPFFCARRPWEPKWLPRPPPRAPKTSPSLDFHRFWVDSARWFVNFLYQVGYFLSGLPHYLFCLPRAFIFKFLATSSNVLGSSAGVSKVTKKCGAAHLLSSLPLCFR